MVAGLSGSSVAGPPCARPFHLGVNVKSFKLLLAGAALAVAAFGVTSAQAAVWNGAGGTAIAIPAINAFGGGPETIAPGIVWSSTNASTQSGSVFGYTGGYGLGSNGSEAGNSIIGLNDTSSVYGVVDSMTITFAHAVNAFGGIINWYADGGDLVTISAYDASNNLLDSLVLSNGSGNVVAPGAFYGFTEGSASIKSFVLTDGYVIAYGLESSGGSVPEPATWALMLGGFGLAGVALRRRQVAVAA